jgi:DNA polymerase III alpha subunit (gram-positive type)
MQDEITALLQRDLAFLDCEMTGGDYERNDIIEIGCVRSMLPSLAVKGEYGVKVAPRSTRGSDLRSVKIAHYTPQLWKHAIPVERALDELRQFTDGCLLVGWATHNDLLFVNATTDRLGLPRLFDDGYIELQDWAQRRFGLARSPGLQRIADQLKVVRDQEHSALDDALVTYEVFRMLWRFGPDELEEVLPSLSWDSYAELAGDVELDEETLAERLRELAGYVVIGADQTSLLARRRG